MLCISFSFASSNEKKRKTRENTGMAADEGQKQNEVIAEARNEGKTVHFASLMDPCHLKTRSWNQHFKSMKAESYAEVTL